MVVSNVMKLIEDCIISALQSLTMECQRSPIEAAVSTAIVTVIDKQVGEMLMSELVKVAESQAQTGAVVMWTVANKLIACDELLVPITRVVERAVNEETCKVETVYITEDKMAKIPLSPPSPEPFGSDYSRNTRKSRRTRRTSKIKEKISRQLEVIRIRRARQRCSW